jgi:hypothetical protein
MIRNSMLLTMAAAVGMSSLGARAAAAQDGENAGAALAPSPSGTSETSDDSSSSSGGVEKGTFGLGLIVGLPTGISAKLYLKDDQAVQGAFGINFVSGGVHLHGDYVFHPYILQDKEEFTMPLYVGPGARLVQYREGRDGDNYVALGARGVAGMLFDFKELPLDVFLEVALVLEYGFADDEGFAATIDVGGGARYYF